MSEAKRIYRFGRDARGRDVTEGSSSEEFVLGGKGAGLAEMAKIGLPVPPGFTVTCQACMEYVDAGGAWPAGMLDLIDAACRDLERRAGRRLGDPHDPLLVSVRTGAPLSLPGMMETVLDLGLNDEAVEGLAGRSGNPRFAWDSYRRFVQMFSASVMGVDAGLFENAVTAHEIALGAKSDTDLAVDDLKGLVAEFKLIFADNVDVVAHPEVRGDDGVAVFPEDPRVQLRLAIQAAFGSWDGARAVAHRAQNGIPDDLGTAVNVMAMVFGNMGDTSATGVAFTRDPADGTKQFYGKYLVNAQGEDVVSSVRTAEPLASLRTRPGLETAAGELEDAFRLLESHYGDMMDVEFTIERGRLYMLQARVGKRTAAAALKIAVDMGREGLITKEEAVDRVDPDQLDLLLYPQFDRSVRHSVLATGLDASPGAAVGAVVFSSADALEAAGRGEDVILVRWETNPDDLAGMIASKGILTSHGGKNSHAAVIARGRGMPCVCGAEALRIDAARKQVTVAGTDAVLREGDVISIDGMTGEVVGGAVPLVGGAVNRDLETILAWEEDIRARGV